ncbi:MAG: translocation/assembly module TamB domain-containing protein [Blastocatellia bacterium]|nr:translocation/assembly module TamB domain-containing protein [Blastocatellia bacterium]
MNPNSTEPITQSRPRRWPRRILVSILILAALLGMAVVGVRLYLRSESFNRYLSAQIQEKLTEYGIRSEIGGFAFAWSSQTARLKDLKLYNERTGQPLVTLREAEIECEIRDLWAARLSREIAVKAVRLAGLELRVEIDAAGVSNFEGLRMAPSTSKAVTFDTSAMVTTLTESVLHFKDRSRGIEAELNRLSAEARAVGGTPEATKVDLRSTAGRLTYEGRELALDKLALGAEVSPTGARIESLSLASPAGEATIRGTIEDWSAPRYGLDLQASVRSEEVARVLQPDLRVRGMARAALRVEGERETFRLRGEAGAEDLVVSEDRLRGLRAGEIQVEGDPKLVRFNLGQIRVNAVEFSGVTIGSVAFNGLKGETAAGKTRATVAGGTAGSVEWKGSRLDSLTLRGLTAEVNESGRYLVKTDAILARGEITGAKFTNATAKAVYDNEFLRVDEIRAALFGGTLAGSYVLPVRAGAPSTVKATFADVRTQEAASLLTAEAVPVSGRIRGEVDLRFVGTDLRTLNGTIQANFEGVANEKSDAIPLTGETAIRAENGNLIFDRARLSTGPTQMTAEGRLAFSGDSDLRVTLLSTEAEQMVQIARSIEATRPFIEQQEPQLIGDFRFDGRVTGEIERPTVEGDVTAGTVGLRDAILGALSAHVAATPTEMRIERGSIRAQNDGSVKFDLVAPFDPKAETGRLDAVLDRMTLETILAAVGSPDAGKFISGDLTGEAHLTGLPGTLEGSAEVRLVNGRVADQPAELAVAELRFDGRDARLEKLEVKLPQSHLSAEGSMNLDDYAFLLQGKADQIALGNLAETVELRELTFEGVADAEFQVSGKALVGGKQTDLDWESLRVELTARGQGVKVNGRDAGDLRLTAHTSPGGRIDAELITGILTAGAAEKGKPEILKASIELRKSGRPIVVESDLSSLNIPTLLATFAPDLAPVLTGTASAKLRIEGPTVDENGVSTFERLRGGLTITQANLSVYDNPIRFDVPATVSLEGARLMLPAMRLGGQGVELNVGGTLGLVEESAMNFSLNGAINFDRLPSIAAGVVLYGGMKIDARLTGTLAEPKVDGAIDVEGFGLSTEEQPIFINDGAGRITLAGDQLTLEKFTAKANEGTVEISGVTKLEQLRAKEWRYNIKASDAEIVLQDFSATISGGLTLAGTPAGQTLSGTVMVPQAEYQPAIDIDNLTAGGGTGNLAFGGFGNSSDSLQRLGLPPVNLRIRVEARDSLIIRNEQINTVGGGVLMLGGRLDDPDPTGRIALDGGTLRFRGQRYEITTGALDLPSGGAPPLLNLVAEGAYSGYRVYIGLIGPTDNIDLTLRSEPELARTEILNLITTGRTEAGSVASQDPLISGVGAAASLLTTGLISKPAEQLLGLSRFQIDPIIRPNLNPAARLTIGQQLFRNFYISYSTNLATEQDQTALAEYTFSNRFSALATFTQGGSAARQSVREGVFSLELRGRQRFSLGFSSSPSLGPGDGGDALARLVRPKLPPAQVVVTPIPGFKFSNKTQRELLPVASQGFSRSLARLGEGRLKEYLQESGYFFATVKSRCEPESCAGERLKLIYEIDPNVIYDLKDIRIEGTDLVRYRDIQDRLQSKTASTLSGNPFLRNLPILGGYVRGLTSNDRLSNDTEFLRLYLADIGYRNARVKYRQAVSPDTDDLIIIFDVDPGAQSEVADIAVRGNAILSAEDLLAIVPVEPGEAFSYTRLRMGTQQIRQLYARYGFLEAVADPEIIELDNDRVRLVYNINEGARAFVSQIEIAGTTKTGKGWIQRYFDFKEGDLLTPAKIRQTQRDLYSTNAFREVNVRAEPLGGDDGSAHKVTLNLTEAKPLLFVYGLGYSTDDGVRGLLELANTNFRGTLDALSLRLRASSREQFSQLSFTDLRPFGAKLPTTISLFYNRNSNLIPFVRRRLIDNNGNVIESDRGRSFGLNRFAAFIQSERKLNDRSSLRFRYNIERASLFNIDPDTFPETEVTRNERAIRLGMFSVGISHDTRDNVLNPSRGQLISADHSLAARILGGNESFNKFFGTYQRYRTLDPFTPLLKNSTLAFSARIGLGAVYRDADRNGDNLISDSEQRLPISERFFSGGATTLRGFRFETAGPQGVLEPRAGRVGELPTLVPLGGDGLAIFNFELRYPLSQRFRFVPFYDLGNVFRRVSDFSFSRMTNTVGVGFRINTPLGPVGVDYGFLIDPPAYATASGAILRQPRGTIHIRFGQSF